MPPSAWKYLRSILAFLGLPGAIVHAPYTGRTVEVDFVTKGRKLSSIRV